MTRHRNKLLTFVGLTTLVVAAGACSTTSTAPSPGAEDRYASFVWPPPPDEARIQLIDVMSGRSSVEMESTLKKKLFAASPQQRYDWLQKPYATAIDSKERILVTDIQLRAVFRFDRRGGRLDILGTQGHVSLQTPLGLAVGDDDTIYVADAGLKKVVALDAAGDIASVYGKSGELENPTDVALSPDASELFVADSKAHRIVVFDAASGAVLRSFGRNGAGEGEFNYPTSLSFSNDGELLVVDQLNARIQLFTPEGDYLDSFGGRGTGFGQFVRPKDVTVGPGGLILVTDAAFNNVQIFDIDFQLLTFVGSGGKNPGQFLLASGVAARGAVFAVVDQLGHRVQLFRFIDATGG